MSELEVGLIAAASIAGYLFGASAVFTLLDKGDRFERDVAVVGACIWPVVLVMMLGAAFARKVTGRD